MSFSLSKLTQLKEKAKGSERKSNFRPGGPSKARPRPHQPGAAGRKPQLPQQEQQQPPDAEKEAADKGKDPEQEKEEQEEEKALATEQQQQPIPGPSAAVAAAAAPSAASASASASAPEENEVPRAAAPSGVGPHHEGLVREEGGAAGESRRAAAETPRAPPPSSPPPAASGRQAAAPQGALSRLSAVGTEAAAAAPRSNRRRYAPKTAARGPAASAAAAAAPPAVVADDGPPSGLLLAAEEEEEEEVPPAAAAAASKPKGKGKAKAVAAGAAEEEDDEEAPEDEEASEGGPSSRKRKGNATPKAAPRSPARAKMARQAPNEPKKATKAKGAAAPTEGESSQRKPAAPGKGAANVKPLRTQFPQPGTSRKGARAPAVDLPQAEKTISEIIRASLVVDREKESKRLAVVKAKEEVMNRKSGEQQGAGGPRGAKQEPRAGPSEPPKPRPAEAAPQVQVVDGKIIINQETLVVEAQGQDEVVNFRRVMEDQPLLNARSYSNWSKAERWKQEDTELFYQAIGAFGTDFTLITRLFPSRTRSQVKRKYLMESKKDPDRIDGAVRGLNRDPAKLRLLIGRLKQDGSVGPGSPGGAAVGSPQQAAPRPSSPMPGVPLLGAPGDSSAKKKAAAASSVPGVSSKAGTSASRAERFGLGDGPQPFEDDDAYIY